MISRIVALALGMALVGCNSTPKERIVYRDVPTIIQVPCKTKPVAVTPKRLDTIPLDSNIFEFTRAWLADREDAKAENLDLRSANEACN